MKKLNYCIDCQIEISRRATRCHTCDAQFRIKKQMQTGINSSQYKHGKYCKDNINHCVDCGKEISQEAKRCNSCGQKGERGSNWQDGKMLKINHCIDCGKEIYRGSKRCQQCGYIIIGKKNKERYKNPENCSRYKDGRTLKTYYCKVCGKKISYQTALYAQGICFKCVMTTVTPNKPEKALNKLLNKLFPKEYKFVGNSKLWIGNFNPDFVDKKNKKIIEMYGDYWHNREEVKSRDKRRLVTYKKHGYKILIIWEHELKLMPDLINKLKGF